VYYSTYGAGGHVHTIEQGTGRRRRRRHSAEFKAEVVAACRRPGVSSAAVALAHSINANLLRRWVAEAERDEGGVIEAPEASAGRNSAFVALPVPTRSSSDAVVRIEVRRGALTVSVQWPSSAAHECAIWLREVLK
jgi:transposase